MSVQGKSETQSTVYRTNKNVYVTLLCQIYSVTLMEVQGKRKAKNNVV